MAKKHKDISTDQVAEPVTMAAASMAQAVQQRRSPIKTFVIENVSGSIFMREHVVRGSPMRFYSVSFTRSYKDSAGRWMYAKSFDVDDLGRVVTVAQQAAEYIGEMIQTDESSTRVKLDEAVNV